MTLTRMMAEARVDFIERADAGLLWLSYVRAEQLDIIQLAQRAIVVAVTHCRFFAPQRFEFSDAGQLSAVIEVFGPDDETVIDLCAWPLKTPEQFATLLGRAAILGSNALINPASWFADQKLRAWHTPLQWLKAGCSGIVPLEQSRRTHRMLGQALGQITCEDRLHCHELWRGSGLRKQVFRYD